MKINIYNLLIFALLLTGIIYPQDTSDKIVDIKAATKSNLVKPGKETELEVKVGIKKGWHINANKPLDKNLVATSLSFKDSPDYTISGITYPEPVMSYLSFSENELALYEQEVVILVKIKAGKKANGKITVNGQLQYQPCNDQTCLFPYNKSFSTELTVN